LSTIREFLGENEQNAKGSNLLVEAGQASGEGCHGFVQSKYSSPEGYSGSSLEAFFRN
jgi:hypothetical protein